MAEHRYSRNEVPQWARVFLLVLAVLLCIVIARSAFGECGRTVWGAIQVLQPWYHRTPSELERARRAGHLLELTIGTCIAAKVHHIDPLLAVAVAFRESSLIPRVGLGAQNGLRGEMGYWQVMPHSTARRFQPNRCSQHDPKCNAMTALGYMAWLRDTECANDDPWIWLGAYGRGPCPTPIEARTWSELRVARRHLCTIEPRCNEVWPE
jgi:hypothetical protein